MFTVTQLLPRRKYIFYIEALSLSSHNGPPANITLETPVLQGELQYHDCMHMSELDY